MIAVPLATARRPRPVRHAAGPGRSRALPDLAGVAVAVGTSAAGALTGLVLNLLGVSVLVVLAAGLPTLAVLALLTAMLSAIAEAG